MATTTVVRPTAQQSLTVMRNVLGATIGSITYLRNLFPDDNFRDTRLNGLQLKTLLPNKSSEADQLIDWILKTMVFGIYLDETRPDRFIEAYTFSFSYPDKDRWCISISADGKRQFSFKTRDDPLPEKAFLTMRIYYYDDCTPQTYEPPMFRAGVDAPLIIASPASDGRETKPVKIDIGHVPSPYHSLRLRVLAASAPSDQQISGSSTRAHWRQEHGGSAEEDPQDNDATHLPEETKSVPGAAADHDLAAGLDDLALVDRKRLARANHPAIAQDVNTQELIAALNPPNWPTDSVSLGANALLTADPRQSPLSAVAPPAMFNAVEMQTRGLSCHRNEAVPDTQPLSPVHRTQLSMAAAGCLASDHVLSNDDISANAIIMETRERLTRGRMSMLMGKPGCPEPSTPQRGISNISSRSQHQPVVHRSSLPSPACRDRVQEGTPQQPFNVNMSSPLICTPPTGKKPPSAHHATLETFQHQQHQPADSKEAESRLDQTSAAFPSTSAARVPVQDSCAMRQKIDCPCGIHDDDKNLIMCTACSKHVHAVCLGFLPSSQEHSPDQPFTCSDCEHSSPSRTDLRPAEGNASQLALLRRALFRVWALDAIDSISALVRLLGVPFRLASQVSEWLVRDGFLAPITSRARVKYRGGNQAKGYDVVKTPQTTARYNSYFNQSSESFKDSHRSPAVGAIPPTPAISDPTVTTRAGPRDRPQTGQESALAVCVDSMPLDTTQMSAAAPLVSSQKRLFESDGPFHDVTPQPNQPAAHPGRKRRKVSVVQRDLPAL
ncbi:HORMA domain-containing protein [Entophlyctis helioformis]|nr:HORMA domain-containing protein [Entophlyctis helioformis]